VYHRLSVHHRTVTSAADSTELADEESDDERDAQVGGHTDDTDEDDQPPVICGLERGPAEFTSYDQEQHPHQRDGERLEQGDRAGCHRQVTSREHQVRTSSASTECVLTSEPTAAVAHREAAQGNGDEVHQAHGDSELIF